MILVSSSACPFLAQPSSLSWKKNSSLFGLHFSHCSIPPVKCTTPIQTVAAFPSSSEVQARISAAASTGRLDLSDCGLQEVPLQVFAIPGLTDLSLAGNNITHLQDDIKKLKNLRRLGLAGNRLSELPADIGKLKQLEGLWIHGNLLRCLPEQIGHLGKLRVLALAGNMIEALPDSISSLTDLQILSIAGNNLEQIPLDIGRLTSLRVLALNGNYFQSLPLSLKYLTSLQDLWLQGNHLESLPSDLSGMSSLKQLSLADNCLKYLPDSVGKLHSLESLWLYGNNLTKIPHSMCHLKQLLSLWLEGNPLEAEHLQDFSLKASHLKAFGVDSLVNLSKGLQEGLGKAVKISKIVGTRRAPSLGGYFKLQQSEESFFDQSQARVLVVAFGSAPGVPNWGGLLQRMRAAMVAGNVKPAFDILYVVDSRRSWYTENTGVGLQRHSQGKNKQSDLLSSSTEDQASYHGSSSLNHVTGGKMEELRLSWYYRQELEEALRKYKRVIMLGDSMGASAALMFSPLATSVIAFCPQVDLASSSIRPGRERTWLNSYKEELLDAVMASSANITVHCGSWAHDLYQAKLLPDSKVELVTHNIDDHRLAKELDSNGSLLTLVKSRVEEEITLATQLAMT